jgi:large exoprotein involved in heme utilization and adhesion
LTIINRGEISATTLASGNAGRVTVAVSGALTIDGAGETFAAPTGIFSQAKSSGSAGTVSVDAGTLVIANDGVISSKTMGLGNGGTVSVMAGNVTITSDGSIATDTVDPGSGSAGSVFVDVAGQLMINGASQTTFTGISSRSTQGSEGNAGDVSISAGRLSIGNGGAISTAAEGVRSTANGGDITLSVGEFLYLVGSEITTSVRGETGNGGNISIDSQLVVLDHSSIIAEAIEGHGGDITITAGNFIPSTDSIVSATSQKGISGTVLINGPLVDLNGTLVVLSSELRSAVALTRDSCAARANRPQSSLVEAGRGGLLQDPDITLPSLYIAGRDIGPHRQGGAGTMDAAGPLQTTLHLTMRCGQ